MKNRRNGHRPPGSHNARQGGWGSGNWPDARPTGGLTHALAAAWPDFQAFDIDDRSGTARGIIPAPSGYGPTATLGFTRETGLLRIDVELGRPVESGIAALLELPFGTRWTRAMRDREDGIVWLRAATICESPGSAGPAIRALARDLGEALRSELLRLALGDDWAGEHHCQGGL